MDIFLIGSEGSERLAQFQRSAREQGRNIQRDQVGAGMIDSGDVVKAIVLFDDGDPALADSLAEIRDHVCYSGVLLAAVTANGNRERLQAAGASVVCDPTMPDADILQELSALCDVQPVSEETRAEFLEPFVSATHLTLQEWATTDA